MKEQLEKTLESKEKPTSRIVLEFFRHGKREKTKHELGETSEEDVNEQINLSLKPEGRKQATEKGKKIHPQPEVALSVGSPRKRAKETAVRVMLAEKDKITPEMSFEEIEKVISPEQKYGKRIIADPRLDFNVEGPVGEKANKAYYAGRTMQYLIYESDQDAIKLKDKESTTYSRAAGNVAELIKRYADIAPNFDKVVKNNPKKYAQYNNQMERYFGSHQSVIEPLLVKVLEKIKGIEYRDKFIESLGAGFKDAEGFRVEINNTPQGPEIEIKYKMGDKDGSEKLPYKTLEEIIEDKDELNKKIKES